jgi:hypothetical protein
LSSFLEEALLIVLVLTIYPLYFLVLWLRFLLLLFFHGTINV